MSALSALLLVWRIQLSLGPALRRYREVYTRQTHVTLEELFLFVDDDHLWLGTLMLALMAGGLIFACTGSFLAMGVIVLGTFQVPRLGTRWLRRRRLFRYERDLPAALQALAASLRCGLSLPAALRHLLDYSEAPITQEFGLLLREHRVGVPFDTALQHLGERVPSEANILLVAALRVASQTGGALAETLERLAVTLREHQRMQDKVRTLTAQGRLQAWIVGALPLLLLVALSYLDPDAMHQMWTTTAGWITLAVVATLELAGIWLIRRIVTIDI
ncbi:type II secretion system F family protein [Bordetella sp. 02P26C-1]|uniref:type II secretion system F family protein n=1 Tax=unclassified Bordetella TaxID=2630031 RepID=UPI001920E47A